jgi:hypothetical protein
MLTVPTISGIAVRKPVARFDTPSSLMICGTKMTSPTLAVTMPK